MDSFDDQIDQILAFQGNFQDFLELVRSAYNETYGAWNQTYNQQEGTHELVLVTGGWSDNEAVVSAVKRTLFSSIAWRSSAAGGHHVFECQDALFGNDSFAWGQPGFKTAQALREERIGKAKKVLQEYLDGFSMSSISGPAHPDPSEQRNILLSRIAASIVDAI